MGWLALVGYGVSAYGQILEGEAANDNARSVGKQLQQRAIARTAVAQRDAAYERQMGDLVQSRAKAVIATQGGDPSDAGSVEMLARLEAEKEYRAMSVLYTGMDESAGMVDQANAIFAEGKAAKKAAYISAAATVLSGAGSWYGDQKPTDPPQTQKYWHQTAKYKPLTSAEASEMSRFRVMPSGTYPRTT